MKIPAPPGWEWQKIEPNIYYGPDSYPWRKTMALWPVRTISGKTVWRQEVYKRKIYLDYGNGDIRSKTQYCELFDLLKVKE